MKKIIPAFLFLSFFVSQIAVAQGVQLWGMTNDGPGLKDTFGVIFKFDPSTGVYKDVHDFGSGIDGSQPWGSLCKASNGKLYGMTSIGGVDTDGVIFSYDPPDSAYNVVFNFGTVADGGIPFGSLIQLSNGKLYGTTNGSNTGDGVIFSLNPVNSSYEVLHFFGLVDTDGYYPSGSLILANNGKLYGTATTGGALFGGVIFSFDPSDSVYAIVHDFGGSDGRFPSSDLLQASDGKLYGLTPFGGTNGDGIIYRYDPTTTDYKILHSFGISTDGVGPNGSLIQASNGKLYGMTELGGAGSDGMIFSYNPLDSSYIDSHDFKYGITDGAFPFGSLVQASDGNLYGMTYNGGADTSGAIFSFNPSDSTYALIHSFSDSAGGRLPWWNNNLIEDDITTGINPLSVRQLADQVSIYPNPGSGIFTVNSSNNIDVLKVTNLLGQLIYSAQPKQKQVTFSVEETGFYFVTIISANQITTSKIVVSNK